jgi:hypothetical protein
MVKRLSMMPFLFVIGVRYLCPVTGKDLKTDSPVSGEVIFW